MEFDLNFTAFYIFVIFRFSGGQLGVNWVEELGELHLLFFVLFHGVVAFFIEELFGLLDADLERGDVSLGEQLLLRIVSHDVLHVLHEVDVVIF